MTTTEQAPGPNASGKVVLIFMGFVLVVVFAASFFYRMERPGLEVRKQPVPQNMEQAMNGPMKEVMELMQKLKERPDDPDLQLAMAERFMAMGSFDKAAAFLDKVLKVRPDDTDALNALGVVRYNQKDLDGAKQAFEALLTKDAADYRARFNLGLLYKYALNQPDKAAEALKAVVDNPKTDPQTLETAKKELETKAKP